MQESKYWRYDEYLRTIEQVTFAKEVPTGVWLPALSGDGYYIYSKTLEEVKKIAVEDIKEKIEELQEYLKEIEDM